MMSATEMGIAMTMMRVDTRVMTALVVTRYERH